MPETRREQAARLRTMGLSISQIADVMGVGEATVLAHIRLAKQRGEKTRPDEAMALLKPLSQDILDWVLKITPDGASVSDTLRAIITDAYNEETQP